jgi:hypothetical protein
MPPVPPKFSWMPYIIMGVILFGLLLLVPRMGWMGMIIVFFVGIPIVKGLLAMANRTWAERSNRGESTAGEYGDEKPKRRPYRAPSAYTRDAEKPKREPEYTVGDDGELIELDSALEEDAPKRSRGGGDFYV